MNAKYSFAKSGFGAHDELTLDDLMSVQAAVLVFLDDAMCLGHYLQCCWSANGGSEHEADDMSKRHAITALHVKAAHGLEVNTSNWPKIQRYLNKLKVHGGPTEVTDNIEAVVDNLSPEMEARMADIEKQVAALSSKQRENTLIQAANNAAKYSSWTPKNAVETAVQTSINALELIMQADGDQLGR